MKKVSMFLVNWGLVLTIPIWGGFVLLIVLIREDCLDKAVRTGETSLLSEMFPS